MLNLRSLLEDVRTVLSVELVPAGVLLSSFLSELYSDLAGFSWKTFSTHSFGLNEGDGASDLAAIDFIEALAFMSVQSAKIFSPVTKPFSTHMLKTFWKNSSKTFLPNLPLALEITEWLGVASSRS